MSEEPLEPQKRRHHKKLRNGCSNCKLKRVKCDEARPACQNCIRKGLSCVYISEKERLSQKGFRFKDMTGYFVRNLEHPKIKMEMVNTFIQEPVDQLEGPLKRFRGSDESTTTTPEHNVDRETYQKSYKASNKEVKPNAKWPLFRHEKRRVTNDAKKYTHLVKNYSFMSDLVIYLDAYFYDVYLDVMYNTPGKKKYALRVFHDLGREFVFAKQIFYALTALHIYSTCEWNTANDKPGCKKISAKKFMRKFPNIDKYFMLQVLSTHKTKCIEMMRPFFLDPDATRLVTKETSEAVIVTCALITLYVALTGNFNMVSPRLYQTCKSIYMLRSIDQQFGMKHVDKSIMEGFFLSPSPEALLRNTPSFPTFLHEIIKVQPFEQPKLYKSGSGDHFREKKSHNKLFGVFSTSELQAAVTPDKVKKNLKLAIQSILNAFSDSSDEEEEEISRYDLLKIEKDYELSDEEDFGYPTEEEVFAEANHISNAQKSVQADSARCRRFPTYVVSTPSGEKLRYERVYLDLIELVKFHIVLADEMRIPDVILVIVGFSSRTAANDNILYLLHQKDPRVLVIMAYFVARLAGYDQCWWQESLNGVADYLEGVLSRDWVAWVGPAIQRIRDSNKAMHLEKRKLDDMENDGDIEN